MVSNPRGMRNETRHRNTKDVDCFGMFQSKRGGVNTKAIRGPQTTVRLPRRNHRVSVAMSHDFCCAAIYPKLQKDVFFSQISYCGAPLSMCKCTRFLEATRGSTFIVSLNYLAIFSVSANATSQPRCSITAAEGTITRKILEPLGEAVCVHVSVLLVFVAWLNRVR